MSKWNLYEIFSHLDFSKELMPGIRKTAKVSKRTVRKRVLSAIDAEAAEMAEVVPYRAKWGIHKIIAVSAAAVLLLSSGAVTAAAAANGGFSQLLSLVFREETQYPESLENMYSVPDAQIEDTCENIDCKVLGVFGDAERTNVILEFTGANGYHLPEHTAMTNGFRCFSGMGNQAGGIVISKEQVYDSSDSGHLYIIESFEFSNSISLDGSVTYEFDSGYFLQWSEGSGGYYYAEGQGDYYTMREIRNWLGFTGAEVNQKKSLSEADLQRVAENFVKVDTIVEGDFGYLPKDEILTDGSISISFSLKYPITKPVTDQFTYTNSEDGTEIPMNLSLSPFGATIDFDLKKNVMFQGMYLINAGHTYLNTAGYVKLKDGTVLEKTEMSNLGDIGKSFGGSADSHVVLSISFLQPIDPNQVEAIYLANGSLIWEKQS